MYTVNCPHCRTPQHTQANIGDTFTCGQCHGSILLKPLATARMGNIAANLANVTMFLFSVTLFLLVSTYILIVGGCLYTINT